MFPALNAFPVNTAATKFPLYPTQEIVPNSQIFPIRAVITGPLSPSVELADTMALFYISPPPHHHRFKPNAFHPWQHLEACRAGWIQLAEKSFPEILPHVSTCKSPQGMMGSMVKTYFAQQVGRAPEELVYVSVMPCVRKQGEADRAVPESHSAAPDNGAPPVSAQICVTIRLRACIWNWG